MPARYSRSLVWCALLAWSLRADPAPAAAQDDRFSPEQLRHDLAVIEAEIRSNHPDLAHSVDEAELSRALRALDLGLDTPLTRDEAWRRFATLNPVLADGHLFVGFADWRAEAAAHVEAGGAFFPFEVHVRPDAEVFIASQLGGAQTPSAGARLEAINGVDSRVVASEVLARAHGDTAAFRADLVSRRFWFYYWKMYGARTAFDLEITQGERRSLRIPASRAMPSFLADEASFERQFRLELLPCRSALLTLASFAWPDKEQFFEFSRQAFTKIRDAGVQALLIDVRANGGGDDELWIEGILPYIADRPYRWGSGYRKRVVERYRDDGETVGAVVTGTIDRWIQPEPENPLRYSGRAYVLIGPSTYSSAILFVNTVQHFGFATLAGTGDSARADQSGSVQTAALPNTGLAVRWPRFILTRPSAATSPALVEPDVPILEDPFRPDAAVDELVRRAAPARCQ